MERTAQPVTSNLEAELEAAEQAFNLAMISNDVAEIRNCISPDWVLVTPERGPIEGHVVLTAIESRILTHATMEKQTRLIRIIGDFAFVTGRGQNTGQFRGEPISADEWVTDIYQRCEGRWICVLTHLTPVTSA